MSRLLCVRALALILLVVAAAACNRDPSARKQAFVTSGDRYLAAGKFREAALEYRNALQIDQRFGEARLKLAQTFEKMGDGRGAMAEYVRAADLMPDNVEVQVTAGRYLLAARQSEAALARADAALAKAPRDVQAHILRGNALGGLKDLDTAVKEMQEAIELDPKRGASYTQLGLVELARGRQKEAETALKQALSLDPSWIGGHLALANFYWTVGRHAEAERAFQAAHALQANDDVVNRAFASFLIATGRGDAAEPYLKQIADNARTPEAVFSLANYYMASNRPKQAVAVLEPVAAAPTPVDGARHLLARALAAAGDRTKAYATLETVLKESPSDALAKSLQGQLLLDDGRLDQALEAAQSAANGAPQLVAAQFTLGRAYAARGDLAGAEKAFKAAITLNPAAVPAQLELSALQLRLATPQDALKTAQGAVDRSPNSAAARMALARSLLAVRDFPRAEKEIQGILRARPDDPSAHVLNGVLAAGKNQPEQARQAFDKALSLDASSLEALAGQLSLDVQTRNYAAVKSRLDESLTGSPDANVMMLAARTYSAIGDTAATEAVLKRTIESSPSLLAPYAMLGQLYLNQRKLDEARREFEALATRQSRPVGALTMAGVILQAQGNVSQAAERFERAVAIDSRAAVAANNLAWIYAERGDNLQQAMRLAETAAEVMPDTPEVLDTLGWVYFKNNVASLATRTLERSVAKAPKNPSYQYHLGLAYAKNGEPDKAKRALRQALELKGDFPGADDARTVLAGLGSDSTR